MKTFQEYIDQYGWSGRHFSSNDKAPLVMMLRDEIANPGATQLSGMDRFALEQAFDRLQGQGEDERLLATDSNPFVAMRFDTSKVPPLSGSAGSDAWSANMEAGTKLYGSIVFVHGAEGNPFTQHTDVMANDGTITMDVAISTDHATLVRYFDGNAGSAWLGESPYDYSDALYHQDDLTSLLELAMQYGLASADEVQAKFGSNPYWAESVAIAIAHEAKLPTVHALADPVSDQLFKAYIAYFGRPADPSGLQFWANAVNATQGDPAALVEAFGTSDEYRELYAGADTRETVDALYQHLFNRHAETAGLDFWAGNLEAGNVGLAEIAFTLVNAAQGGDLAVIGEKVAAARAFTAALDTRYEVDAYQDPAAPLNARKWLSTVTGDHAQNVKIVGMVNDVINQLEHSVDPVLAAYGLQPAHY